MDGHDRNMTFTFVDPVKVEVKVEANEYNPWFVEHASAFLQYCCPECEYKNGNVNLFEDHAFQNHENSRVLFVSGEKMDTEFSENLPSGLKIHKFEPETIQSSINFESEKKYCEKLRITTEKRAKAKNKSRLKIQKLEDDIQPKIEQKMTCELCLVEFGNEKILKSHMREQHMAEGLYFCSHCDSKCKKFGGLKNHIDTTHPETGEKKFFCNVCNKGFIYKSTVALHRAKNSCIKHMCELCGIEYNTLRGLQVHMAKNHNTGEEQVLMCDKCDFSAPHKILLQRHVKHKHDIDKHKKCPCCDFKTPQPQKLYIHIDNHHPEYDEKKFSCEKCGRSFIYESSLKSHVNFTCKFSGYIYPQSSKRKQKSKKKSNVKCDYCSEILNGGNIIQRHYRKVHPNKPIILDGIDKFQCSYCKAFFFSKLNLERHSHLKHGKEPDAGKKFCKKCSAPFSNQHKCQKENGKINSYPCENCHVTFTSKDNLESHVLSVHEKRLDFSCDHCGKKCPTLKVLDGHIKQVHSQNVKCEICDKKISNPIELRRHKVFVHKQTDGAWLCEMCPKSAFFSKTTFEKHMKTKH